MVNSIDKNKENFFDHKHFKSFSEIDNDEKKKLMTVISTEVLAVAVCLVSTQDHLDGLMDFMDSKLRQGFLYKLSSIEHLPPSSILVERTQKMIIAIHNMFGELSSNLSFFLDISVLENGNQSLPLANVHKDTESAYKDLYSMTMLEKELNQVAKKDMKNFKNIIDAGSKRRLIFSNKTNLNSLNKLEKHYPNFKSVIDIIRASCHVSLLGNTRLTLPIINLQGEPGIGKTVFAKALAKALDLEFFPLNISSMHNRFELVGSNRQYSDANIGGITQIMCLEAKTFQPLILLDELCMAKDTDNESVIHPLYAFFDQNQRKAFKDHYLNIDLDLSGALIITTTNEFEKLRPALKSRLTNIEIKPPTAHQMKYILQTTYNSCLQEMGLTKYFTPSLSPKLIQSLCKASPRESLQLIQIAIGTACSRANNSSKIQLLTTDFNFPLLPQKRTEELISLKKVIH